MQPFKTQSRPELDSQYRVFYVTAWGYAADHLIGWFPKALNCHHDMFALLAHEGSRPKYLSERTRADRPALIPFTEFLNDMGMTYASIGDCYSYRAGQMDELLRVKRYSNIPVVNILRHPAIWLEHYVRWRSSNMRMRNGSVDPLQWEWKTSAHGYFRHLGLRTYSREDVDVWASFQGMLHLNNIVSDLNAVKEHCPIEKVSDRPEEFCRIVDYLSRGAIQFDKNTLMRAYETKETPFRGDEDIPSNPDLLLQSWPGWKIDAFRKLVSAEAMSAYKAQGYHFQQDLSAISAPKRPEKGLKHSLFVSSLPKSGTWLLREVLELATGLKPFEPHIDSGGVPDYSDEMLIEFQPGHFFSWHSIIGPRTKSLLNCQHSYNIFLIRNIYDVLLSMLQHLLYDVDAAINRSIQSNDYFSGKTVEQCLTLMISGFRSPKLSWEGAIPIIRQMDSMLEFGSNNRTMLLDYSALAGNKKKSIRRISTMLNLDLSAAEIDNIVLQTSKEAMRERLGDTGRDLHVTKNDTKLFRTEFLPYHEDMMNEIIALHAPKLRERLIALGLSEVLTLRSSRASKLAKTAKRHVILPDTKRSVIQYIKRHIPMARLPSKKRAFGKSIFFRFTRRD